MRTSIILLWLSRQTQLLVNVHVLAVKVFLLTLSPPVKTFITLLWLMPDDIPRQCGPLGVKLLKNRISKDTALK